MFVPLESVLVPRGCPYVPHDKHPGGRFTQDHAPGTVAILIASPRNVDKPALRQISVCMLLCCVYRIDGFVVLPLKSLDEFPC